MENQATLSDFMNPDIDLLDMMKTKPQLYLDNFGSL